MRKGLGETAQAYSELHTLALTFCQVLLGVGAHTCILSAQETEKGGGRLLTLIF